MPLEILSCAEFAEPDFESDLDSPWAENIVTATATVMTALLVSSVAVLMYLA